MKAPVGEGRIMVMMTSLSHVWVCYLTYNQPQAKYDLMAGDEEDEDEEEELKESFLRWFFRV